MECSSNVCTGELKVTTKTLIQFLVFISSVFPHPRGKRHQECSAVSLWRLRQLRSVLFVALRIVLNEHAERGVAEQERLEDPLPANGRVVDAFVAGRKQK